MKKHLTILFSIAVLFFIPLISFAQQQDSLIQLYPTLGDTITRQDNEIYNLFPAFPGFKCATIYICSNDYLITRITYIAQYGKEKDTTLTQPINMLGNYRLKIRIINEEILTEEKIITLTTNDNRKFTGNVAMIDNCKLVLFVPAVNYTPQNFKFTGSFITLPKNQLKNIIIKNNSKSSNRIAFGTIIGGVIGFAFGVTIASTSDNNPNVLFHYSTEELKLTYGTLFGLVGALLGLTVAATSSVNYELIKINNDEDYNKLIIYFKDVYMANRSFINHNY